MSQTIITMSEFHSQTNKDQSHTLTAIHTHTPNTSQAFMMTTWETNYSAIECLLFRLCKWVSGLVCLTEKSKVSFPSVRLTIIVLSSNRFLANIRKRPEIKEKKKKLLQLLKKPWKLKALGIPEGTGSLWIFIHTSATAQMFIPT